MKLKRVVFYQVTSRFNNDDGFEIPKDMLRYDEAFVNPEFPNIVAFPKFHTKYGDTSGVPTAARWHSFGCRLTLINGEQHYELLATMGKSWTTYRNPKNYGQDPLVPFVFEKYLTVKDHKEL